ncbi:MAG: GntR family transcriptional regulator [Planctomycetota bacterium]
MTTKSKNDQIIDYVLDLILSEKYRAGDRLPSDGQLVRQFKTSRPTVAKAMRQLEDRGYIDRRVGSGSFVLSAAKVKPSLIGMLAPEVGEAELFEPLCSEIAKQCQKHGLSLLWPDSSLHASVDIHHERLAQELCERYIAQGVAGVFFAPVEFSERMVQINREIAMRLNDAGISVVLLDRDLERTPSRSEYDWVGIDNFRAGSLQTQYLVGRGCKHIAYVSRIASAPTIDLRIAGFQHVVRQSGLKKSADNIICGDVRDPGILKQLDIRKIDGVVCSNDTTACFLLATLKSEGIQVPEDIYVIGIDDVKYSSDAIVPLTTVRQPFRAIGQAAVATMVGRIENRSRLPREVFLEVQVIPRESCGELLSEDDQKRIQRRNSKKNGTRTKRTK